MTKSKYSRPSIAAAFVALARSASKMEADFFLSRYADNTNSISENDFDKIAAELADIFDIEVSVGNGSGSKVHDKEAGIDGRETISDMAQIAARVYAKRGSNEYLQIAEGATSVADALNQMATLHYAYAKAGVT